MKNDKPLQYGNLSNEELLREYNRVYDELSDKLGKDKLVLADLLEMEREITIREE